MDIVACISNVAGAVKEFFGFQSKKLDLKNSAPVQAAEAAQQEVKAEDKTKAAIADQDAGEIQKELSE